MAGLFGAPLGMRGTMLGGRGIMPGDQPGLPQMPQEAPRKPGLGTRLLGQGWEEKVGALGGLLRGDPNALADYQGLQQHRADQAEAMRQASLERDNDWQDWVQREQWKRDNPAPVNNDTVSDYEFIRSTLGDEQAREFLRNKANPPTYRVGPDGQFYRVDVATPPTAPVGRLTPIEEGGAGNGAGGFRP